MAAARSMAAGLAPVVDRARRVEREAASLPNRVVAIRPKNRVWLTAATEKSVKHENFFIAKICDSESTHTAFRWCRRLALHALAQ